MKTEEFEKMFLESDFEVLNETTVYVDTHNNVCICVHGPGSTERNYRQKPYFKVCNATNFGKSNLVARIYFDSPEYVYPEHHDLGKEVWYFNSTERKIVDKLINNNWNNMIEAVQPFAPKANYIKPDYTQLRRKY